MGIGDKISNAAEDAVGKVKETAGRAMDDESLEAEGQADQADASFKQAGEKVKDKMAKFAAAMLNPNEEADASDMVFESGRIYFQNAPGQSVGFSDVAAYAYVPVPLPAGLDRARDRLPELSRFHDPGRPPPARRCHRAAPRP